MPLEKASGLVWLGDESAELKEHLRLHPAIAWVQLASTGIEQYLSLIDDGRSWTCARGVFGRPVAEHALMLTLACLRQMGPRTGAAKWHPYSASNLAGRDVVVLGVGSIGREVYRLLQPFDARVTLVGRRSQPVHDASALSIDGLDDLLAAAEVLILAAPLTAETSGLIDANRLARMPAGSSIVNVGRGKLVVTADLIESLASGHTAAAGLDVTDPEPLPDDHPLWNLSNCLITPHVASSLAGAIAEFAGLVEQNVRRWRTGMDLLGTVDVELGY